MSARDLPPVTASGAALAEIVRIAVEALAHEAVARVSRIDAGEECERCASRDIEHSDVIVPLFVCRDCGHARFDLREEVTP